MDCTDSSYTGSMSSSLHQQTLIQTFNKLWVIFAPETS
jgi:hypothetical protein